MAVLAIVLRTPVGSIGNVVLLLCVAESENGQRELELELELENFILQGL